MSCKYCASYFKEAGQLEVGEIFFVSNAKCACCGDGRVYYVPMKFCPACGKKLEYQDTKSSEKT